MIGYRYSPFSKPLADFPPEELAVLRDVAEGWFVDYKSEPLSAKDFGKHLSAFANQFGGWLFIGVEEGPNKSLKAGAFPGIPSASAGTVLVRIREAINAHGSPPFYFEHRVIEGPLDIIGLQTGKCVIVVGVPEAPNPPYVHSTGRIYRRIADSSEPKAETDRAVLDSMWRKSEEVRTQMRDFLLKPGENTRAENTFCYVYLMEDLTFSQPEYKLDLKEFRNAIRAETVNVATMPLDNVYATQDGFIARHVFTNDPLTELVAIRWWRNGNVRLTIPVNYIQLRANQPPSDELLKQFIEAMGTEAQRYWRILNLDQWLFAFFALAVHYVKLRDSVGADGPIYGKVVFSNARSVTPFVGMQSYISAVKHYGIPVVQDSLVMLPPGPEPGRFRILSDSRNPDPFMRAFNLIVSLAMNSLQSLGIMFEPAAAEDLAKELMVALDRGTKPSVQ